MIDQTRSNNHIRDGPEERHPLLFVVREDPIQLARNKGHYEGISSGAATVINQWPGHLTSCWYCCLMIGMVFGLFSFLVFLSSVPNPYLLEEKCRRSALYTRNEHYVVYIVHGPMSWTNNQIQSLQTIAQTYPNQDIKLVMVQSNETQPNNDQVQQLVERNWHLLRWIKQRTVLNGTRKQITFQQFQLNYPRIKYVNVSLERFFASTPLCNTWKRLNLETQLFAMRVLLIWNTGGIVFDLPVDYQHQVSTGNPNLVKQNKIILKHHDDNLKVLKIEFDSFLRMAEDAVTVDVDGIHMETKITCHAFFGDLLMKLMNADEKITPTDIIKKSLEKFCRKGHVDLDYCNRITT